MNVQSALIGLRLQGLRLLVAIHLLGVFGLLWPEWGMGQDVVRPVPVVAVCPTQKGPSGRGVEAPEALRVIHVDMDYIYDADPAQQARNLEALVGRIIALGANTVFLQAFADPVGDGLVREVYFTNRWLPVRADIFQSVSERLRREACVNVYAWLPVLAYDLAPDLSRVLQAGAKVGLTESTVDTGHYIRLSPFDAGVRRIIGEIYEDLAIRAEIDGILFHDDALMTDFEDFSAHALAAYAAAGLPTAIDALRQNPEASRQWTRLKTSTLNRFTLELRDKVMAVQGAHIKTARNIYALPVLSPDSETWFAQNLDDFLAIYDWTAVMAMPLMEGVRPEASEAWLERLVDKVAEKQTGLERTIFELQARDWSLPGQPYIEEHMLASWITMLYKRGARHIGYYPDDFIRGSPNVQVMAPLMRGE